MAATPISSFRLDEFTVCALRYLAEEQEKTMTDVLRDLIVHNAVKTIEFTVYAPDLDAETGRDDVDERASVLEYARRWSASVQAAYPFAAVDWRIEWHIGATSAVYGIRINGIAPGSGTGLVELVAEHVADLGGDVYQEWGWIITKTA